MEPGLDPNSFVRYFIDPPLPLDVRLVGLMAPAFVGVETVKLLRQTEGIRESFERREKLSVLVTSAGGHWRDGCSRLHELYKVRGQGTTLTQLDQAHCIGDLMWCPMGPDGPIVLDKGVRALTLFDLTELPPLIRQGMRVMLVLGPCQTCRRPKSELLGALLRARPRLLSHLVCDSFTLRAVLEELGSGD